jgi:hypothetical protein
MDNVALTCWARSGDLMCFLWGTDKPIELIWVLNKGQDDGTRGKAATYTAQHKHKINADNSFPPLGFEPTNVVLASEDSSSLRLGGHCDRLVQMYV